MALVKAYTDTAGNDYAASYRRAAQLNIGSLDGVLHAVFLAWRDAAAFGEGRQPISGASRTYTLTGNEFLALAAAPPVGDSLYLVLANASEGYVLAHDEFFGDAVQV